MQDIKTVIIELKAGMIDDPLDKKSTSQFDNHNRYSNQDSTITFLKKTYPSLDWR